MISKKGQISIEVLIILGVLVISAVIFGAFVLNNVFKNQEDLSILKLEDKTFNNQIIPECTGPNCVVDPCTNGILDNGEEDVDCGGFCPPCPTPGYQFDLILSLVAPNQTVVWNSFGIKARASYNGTNQLAIQTISIFDEYGAPTSNCRFNNIIINGSITNLNLVMTNLSGNNYELLFDNNFSCDVNGTYRIKMLAKESVLNGSSVQRTVDKTILPQGMQIVDTPFAYPSSGMYLVNTEITLATPTSHAEIYYTVDNSQPSESSTLYSSPIILTNDMNIKAKAYKNNYIPSDIMVENYIVAEQVATPIATPDTGEFTSVQQVSLTTATPGAAIYYTTDCSEPFQTTGTLYTTPITISDSTFLKARAFKENWIPSGLMIEQYTIITDTVATPTASPPGGLFSASPFVSLTTATPGATIRYTLDGSIPTENSNLYSTSPILIGLLPRYLKARAFKPGMNPSGVMYEYYRNINPIYCPNGCFLPSIGILDNNIFDPVIPGGLYPSYPLPIQPVTFRLAVRVKNNHLDDNCLAVPNTLIRYTLDGTEPTINSNPHINGNLLSIMPTNPPTTLKVTTFNSGCLYEGNVTKSYGLLGTTPTPYTPVPSGTYIPPNTPANYNNNIWVHYTYNSGVVNYSFWNQDQPFYSKFFVPLFFELPNSCQIPPPHGSTIRFTLDGTEPTTYSQIYNLNSVLGERVIITQSTVLKAKIFIPGWTPGPTLVRNFELKCNVPEFIQVINSNSSGYKCNMYPSNAIIRYTVDGTEPTENSPIMPFPLVLIDIPPSTNLIKMKCFKDGWTPSDTVSHIVN